MNFGLNFGFGGKRSPRRVIGSYNLYVGELNQDFGYDSTNNIGDLTPESVEFFYVLKFITNGPNEINLLLGESGSSVVPGYTSVYIDFVSLGVTLTLQEGLDKSYVGVYSGIQELIGIENGNTIPVMIVIQPEENALTDKYNAYLVDESGKALIY